jgi:hypothetical protein
VKITRQVSPANAGFSRLVSATGDLGDCVVVAAVDLEPVSTAKFPANREINREFFNFGPDRGSEIVIHPMIQWT